MFIILLNIFFIFWLISCDTCEINSPDSSIASERLYFTSIISNTNNPNIYYVKLNNGEPIEIIQNSILYSKPSENGIICYISKNKDGLKELYTFNINNKRSTFITKESPIYDINNPIISNDGLKIAFSSENKLIVYNNDNSNSFNLITNNLAINSEYLFSLDSKYLALFEEEKNNINLKIIDANNLNQVIIVFSKSESNINKNQINDIISWDNKNNLFYSINKNDTSKIVIINLSTKNSEEIKLINPNINFYNAEISYDGNYLAFINKDDNLWIMTLASKDFRFFKITNYAFEQELSNISWSKNNQYVSFLLKNKLSENNFKILFKADINYINNLIQAKSIDLISNNVFKGFIN
jgi:dipeptidyl aminopeptidase/acylaminoacyl peptidase